MGPISQNELQLILRARDDASKVLEKAGANLRGFATTAERFAKPAFIGLTAAATALVGVAGLFARAAMEDEVASARLEVAIKNTGYAFTEAQREGIEKFVNSLSEMSAFSDEEVKDALTTLVIGTGDVEESMSRLRVAVDLARLAKIPLADASRMLAKLDEEHLNTLRRIGIQIPENATVAEAFAIIQEKAQGAAVRYAQTTEGQWTKLKNRLDNFAEEVGKNISPALNAALDEASRLAASELPRVSAAITELVRANPELVKWSAALVAGAAGLGAIGLAAGPVAAGLAVLTGPVGALALTAGALYLVADTAAMVVRNWDKLVTHLTRTGAFEIPFIGGLLRGLDAVLGKFQQVGQIAPGSGLAPGAGSGGGFGGGGGGSWGTGGGGVVTYGGLTGGTYTVTAAPPGGQYLYADGSGNAYYRMPDGSIRQGGRVVGGGGGGAEFQAAEGGITTRDAVGLVHANEAIIPLDRLGGRGSGLGGVTVIFQGPVYGFDDFRDRVNSAVRETLAGGGFRGMVVRA